jgi:acetyl esterase/lipase
MKNINTILLFIFLLWCPYAHASNSINDVEIESNIKYGEAVNDQKFSQPLLLDKYEIKTQSKLKKPAIIFVHGGGFVGGDKQSELYVKMCKEFAMKGFVAFSINYRLKSKNLPYDSTTLNNAVTDGHTAFIWIKKHGIENGIDTTKVLICGDSAGGGTVIRIALTDPKKTNFIGCIDLWGGLNPINPTYKHTYPWDQPIFPFPIKKGTPPTCIIHGTNDIIVPYQTSKDLSDQLTNAGVYNELHLLDGAKHYPESISSEFIPIMLNFADKIMKNIKAIEL